MPHTRRTAPRTFCAAVGLALGAGTALALGGPAHLAVRPAAGPPAALAPSTVGLGRRWQSPAQPGLILRAFEEPSGPFAPGHRGVDLLAFGPIRAAGAGVISFVGEVGGRPVVTVATGRVRSTVDPVRGVHPIGTRVAAGEVIGFLDLAGPTSHCGRAESCVHWGVRIDGSYVDPEWVLGWDRPVLKADPRRLPGSGARMGLAETRSQTLDRHVRVDLRGRDGGMS